MRLKSEIGIGGLLGALSLSDHCNENKVQTPKGLVVKQLVIVCGCLRFTPKRSTREISVERGCRVARREWSTTNGTTNRGLQGRDDPHNAS
jgi:hypothetical protein